MKHFLKIADLKTNDVMDLLVLANDLKNKQKKGIPHNYLQGKTLGMVFHKPSTRTKASFEAGMYQLGGNIVYLDNVGSQMSRGEPIQDTARTLSRYLDAIMIRTFAQATIEKMAIYSSIPIINGLTDYAHPCQIMADLMTISEYKGNLENVKIAFLGDGNNVANSLIVACTLLGIRLSIGCHPDYLPSKSVIEFARVNKGKLLLTNDVRAAINDVDVIYTDVWTSMGQEESEEKKKVLSKFQVNSELMSYCKEDTLVLHCLPAHRDEEITSEVFEKHQKEIFDQAENRMHMQKAILLKLCESVY